MSNLQSELETHEFEFLEEACDSCDEADAVSPAVIAVEKEAQLKYVKNKTSVPPSHCQPCEETVRRTEKVSLGNSRSTVANGTPALLTFRSGGSSPKNISEEMIHNMDKAFSKVTGCNIKVLQYRDLQILAKFEGTDAYQKFGKCFMNGEIGKINGLELIEVKLVKVMDPCPCYLEVSCSTSGCHKLQADLSSFFVSYCSKFSWITIRETTQKALDITDITQAVDVVPAINMMLMFMTKAQRNAQKFLQAIKIVGKDWVEFSMPKEFCENGEVFYKFSDTPGLSLSILQGSLFAGIKIMVFVKHDLEAMEKFYSLITAKSPLVVDKMGEGIRYRTYSLSKNLELQLVFHPKIKILHPGNVNLCFSIHNVDKVLSGIPGDVCEVGESHWQVKDPEGNSILLYNLLRL